MSSSDSEDGYYSNVVKNMDKIREVCMKKLESESIDLTNNSGSQSDTAANNTSKRTTRNNIKTIQNNVTSVPLNDSIEDTHLLDEIIAKNAKPPPRSRGRKKKESLNSTTVTPTVPPATAAGSRGRGRGRGARGRAAKNNITNTVNNAVNTVNNTVNTVNNTVNTANNAVNTVNNAVNTVELLKNMVGCDASLIEEALFTLTGTRGRSRKRKRASFSPNSSVEDLLQGLLSDSFNGRGRGRGNRGSRRGRGSRSRGTRPTVSNFSAPQPTVSNFSAPQPTVSNFSAPQPTVSNFSAATLPSFSPLYPIFSVGNTDEYPDKSDDIPLFSKPNQPVPSVNQTQSTDDVIMEEIDSEDNEPLSVKVLWKSCQVFKFTIRKYQKITQIFEKFAQQENVGVDKLLFTYNDKILTCNDTPASIDYNIAKFIDGGVVSHSVKIINDEKGKVNGINVKFQCQNRKKPLEITIGKDEKLSLAMSQCAERLETPLEKLKFEFDGDLVAGSTTPHQLGLEDGDCIDVVMPR